MDGVWIISVTNMCLCVTSHFKILFIYRKSKNLIINVWLKFKPSTRENISRYYLNYSSVESTRFLSCYWYYLAWIFAFFILNNITNYQIFTILIHLKWNSFNELLWITLIKSKIVFDHFTGPNIGFGFLAFFTSICFSLYSIICSSINSFFTFCSSKYYYLFSVSFCYNSYL